MKEQFSWSNRWNGTNITKTKVNRKFLFGSKLLTIPKRCLELLRMLFFLNKLENWKTLRIDMKEQFSWSNRWNGTNITKTCFHSQNEPESAKLHFSGVLNLFRGNRLKNFFRGKNVISPKEKKNFYASYFFPTSLKRGKSWGIFRFDGINFFWSNQWSWINITKYCFPPQNDRHTAKQSFSGVLKYFSGNWRKTYFSSTKKWHSQKET